MNDQHRNDITRSPFGPDAQPAAVDTFVRLLGQNQRRIFMYVMSLVPNFNDAEEIVQETNLVLWREFSRFEPGTHFAAWACRVAFHQVLAWRKRRQRSRLEFSSEFIDAVSDEACGSLDHLEERARLLAGCIDRLPAQHRDLLRLRYDEGCDIKTVARRAVRTVEAVYRALSRIRHALHECVTKSLAKGD